MGGYIVTPYEKLPSILRIMDSGEPMSTTEMGEMAGVTGRRMNDIVTPLFKGILRKEVDYELKKWKAKPGFLSRLAFTPEEIAVLHAINMSKESYGESLVPVVEEVLEKLTTKEDALQLYTQNTLEPAGSKQMKLKFNLINSALEKNRVIEFMYDGKRRIADPFRIFTLEYYWYFAAFEIDKLDENKERTVTARMKTYLIAKMSDLRILNFPSFHHFQGMDEILDKAHNSFIDWDKPPQQITLLVSEKLRWHIKRAKFFRNWKFVGPSDDKEGYLLYETYSVHSEFKDVIPTILKHIPDMFAINPPELIKSIKSAVNDYRKNMNEIEH